MPTDTKTQKEPYENLTSAQGPHAPERKSRRPEDNYPAAERDTGANRGGGNREGPAPGGPVNIPVKGGAEVSGPDAARRETPQATGGGSRDAPSLPQE